MNLANGMRTNQYVKLKTANILLLKLLVQRISLNVYRMVLTAYNLLLVLIQHLKLYSVLNKVFNVSEILITQPTMFHQMINFNALLQKRINVQMNKLVIRKVFIYGIILVIWQHNVLGQISKQIYANRRKIVVSCNNKNIIQLECDDFQNEFKYQNNNAVQIFKWSLSVNFKCGRYKC
ncbi:unnamed protein product [Paramecium pentaurelia]|uniref:Transmembrane protein n=1 Tax=Paramecium pentaurelia TaxID=43138 RepID=A0A8S1XIZ6_9CILI|nr:unnamed protein product [Paramecium pentaurelia]